MYDRILITLDGTPLAEQALAPAISLARTAGAHLHLVTVAIPTPIGLPELPYEASIGDVQADYLESLGERARGAGVKEVSCDVLVGGNIVGELEAHRAKVGAGLTVIASHGRGPVRRAWLGSVADRFLRSSGAPVLLVRADPEAAGPTDPAAAWEFKRVLLPLDGSELSRAALLPAKELQASTDASFMLVRVLDAPHLGSIRLPAAAKMTEKQLAEAHRIAEDDLGEVAAELAAEGYAVEQIVECGAPAVEHILGIARERRVDVIAIGTHGHGGVRRAVLGSVADKVIRGADCPVLVVRPDAQRQEGA